MDDQNVINTFNKGMNSDFNVILQPDGTYRYCKNCQLMSQDGNNYVIKDCMGNLQTFTINSPYNAVYTVTGTLTTSIGFISFPDTLVVFSTNSESTTGYGEIGTINYSPYGEGIQPTDAYSPGVNFHKGYQVLYHHASLNFTKLHKIEGFGFEENDLMKRVYWTDNFNEPRVFDLANPIFTTYYASGALSATAGTTYMVLEGAVTYNAVDYGPGLTAGNVFTTTGGIIVYTDLTGPNPTAKVIAYYPYQLLSFTPSRSLGNIKFQEYGIGTVNCGSKIYFYRLGKASDGYFTTWSYGSSPVHVGAASNSVAPNPASTFFNFVGGGTPTSLLNSTRSVKVEVSNIDTNFDTIQLAVAEYDYDYVTPRQIIRVVSTAITGATMTLEHTGGTNLGTETLNSITLFPASILTCKTMTTNKNYNLIANLTERKELSFDKTGATLTEITKYMPVHEHNEACANVFQYVDVSPSLVANPALVDGIWPYTQWLVVSGGTVTYNAVTYAIGDVFEGVVGVFNWAVASGAPVLRPCVFKNKYTTNTAAARPDYIQIKTGFWNYKDPAVDFMCKGLWHKEIYRYGIMFYDLKGNPFYVRWIGDLTTSQADLNGLSQSIQNTSTTFMTYLKAIGCRVSGITIKGSEIDKISGFSIVRAERDKRVQMQGMVMQTGSDGAGQFFPLATPYLNSNQEIHNTVPNYPIYSFISPDQQTSTSGVGISVGDLAEEAVWVQCYVNTSTGTSLLWKASADDQHSVEAKYLDCNPVDGTGNNRTNTISAVGNMPEAQVAVDVFGITGVTFNNTGIRVGAAAPTNVDATCTGAGAVALVGRRCTGGLKMILRLEGGLTYYGFYGSGAAADQYNAINPAPSNHYVKMIMNIVKPPFTQYGGKSESALANTLYISTGHFQPINSTVKAETLNGSGDYVFNNIDVYGGDAYVNLVDYGYGVYDDTLGGPSYSSGIKFPCQAVVNYDLRRGRTVSNNRMFGAPNGVVYSAAGATRLEDYQYNGGYSTDGSAIQYPALPVNYINSGIFKERVRFAGPKFPGEIVNSFRTFLINDYKDLSVQYGEINNIRERDGRVIVWQNKAVVTVPVLERQLLSGTGGAQTTIGTGGVVDRFDPLTSAYGNQHQHGLTETEFGFVWFDMRKKAFMVFDINQGIIEESKIGGLKGFFDEVFLEVAGSSSIVTPVLNSPTYASTSDRPLMGTGIVGVYDPKFKMTYLTFKFTQRTQNEDASISYIAKDFTIGYYHPDKMFVGFFDCTPSIWHNHNQTVLSVNRPNNLTKYYGASMNSTDFVVGDTVDGGDGNWYICIANVTITTFDPSDPTDPTFPASVYWRSICTTDQIWVHNQPSALSQSPAPGYVYDKFFGRVVDQELWVVVNAKTTGPISIDTFEAKGNNINWTEVAVSNDLDTGSDTNIQVWDRNYQFINQSWWSSVPLGALGRLVDNYMLVKFKKRNWATDPTLLTKGVKILQFLKSYWRGRK